MGAQEGSAVSPEVGQRSGQSVARSQRRRRRPNITEGGRHTFEVVLSDAEMAVVREAADEANCTVPWFLVQCAVERAPSGAGSTAAGDVPQLPLAVRRAAVSALMSATGALDEARRAEMAPIGSNVNQMTRASNVVGELEEEVFETLALVREVMTEFQERAERIEELAQRVARR